MSYRLSEALAAVEALYQDERPLGQLQSPPAHDDPEQLSGLDAAKSKWGMERVKLQQELDALHVGHTQELDALRHELDMLQHRNTELLEQASPSPMQSPMQPITLSPASDQAVSPGPVSHAPLSPRASAVAVANRVVAHARSPRSQTSQPSLHYRAVRLYRIQTLRAHVGYWRCYLLGFLST